MKTRTPLAILMAAGTATGAVAQESVTYAVTWTEVNFATGTASANALPGQQAGRIDPGEGVRIAIAVTIAPGIGATATYAPPPPPGVGTIAGIGSIFFDLLGTNLDGGTWSSINRNPGSGPFGPLYNWTLGGPGMPQANGNMLNAQAGQFVLPGSTANSPNPAVNMWRGTWNPSSYSPRVASILSAPGSASGGQHSAILIEFGLDANGNPRYVGKFVPAVFGNTGGIPIAPAPSTLGLMALGAMITGRGRRLSRSRD